MDKDQAACKHIIYIYSVNLFELRLQMSSVSHNLDDKMCNTTAPTVPEREEVRTCLKTTKKLEKTKVILPKCPNPLGFA